MNFTELIDFQRELNKASGVRIPEDPSPRLKALFAEFGELIQALKPEWCWWKHYGKDTLELSEADIAMEAADVLHFLLVEAIARDFQVKGRCPWQLAWESEIEEHELISLLVDVFCWLKVPNGFSQAIVRYVWVARHLGFTQEQIEEAYLQKAEINRKTMGVRC